MNLPSTLVRPRAMRSNLVRDAELNGVLIPLRRDQQRYRLPGRAVKRARSQRSQRSQPTFSYCALSIKNWAHLARTPGAVPSPRSSCHKQ